MYMFGSSKCSPEVAVSAQNLCRDVAVIATKTPRRRAQRLGRPRPVLVLSCLPTASHGKLARAAA